MLNQVLKVRPILLTIFTVIFGAFWVWILLVSNFPIDTRGWAGNVTLVLEGLYVLALPLLGIATISIDCVAVAKRTASLSSAITVILVAAAIGFWAWSLSASGQFELRWRK